jgi:GH15 family glucan-1,4-alpha-glucosidase
VRRRRTAPAPTTLSTHARRTDKRLLAAERARVTALVSQSISVIAANQAASGAYPASPSFPVYRYCWFRDGAFIAEAMSRAGRTESADAFFGWCDRILVARAAQIDSLLARHARGERIPFEDYLPCRYTLDGRASAEDWWEFQLDGYGTWLWALDRHAGRHGRSLREHAEAVELTARYLIAFWAEPCYDWWEEHPDHRHTSTLAAVHGGLRAAAESNVVPPDVRHAARDAAGEIRARILDEGVHEGHLVKWLDGRDIDASLIACSTPFRLLAPDEPLMAATVSAVEVELAHGGVHRYAADTFYGGGEWPLLAALLGWHYAQAGRIDDACGQLLWVADQANAAGDLPEQVSGHLLAPEQYEPWVRRWGPVATPLLWSHAMLITLADELGLLQ